MAPQLERPRIPDPPAETDILREQLEYLIEHTARGSQCGCSECQRYLRVRAALLEIFTEPPRANARPASLHLLKAA